MLAGSSASCSTARLPANLFVVLRSAKGDVHPHAGADHTNHERGHETDRGTDIPADVTADCRANESKNLSHVPSARTRECSFGFGVAPLAEVKPTPEATAHMTQPGAAVTGANLKVLPSDDGNLTGLALRRPDGDLNVAPEAGEHAEQTFGRESAQFARNDERDL